MILTRTTIKKRRSRPRRGRVRDINYLAWLHEQPCLLARHTETRCAESTTAHHVRGSSDPEIDRQRNDRRAVPLCLAHHLLGCGPDAIERLGRRKWEEKFGIDLEAEIARLNAAYGRIAA